MRVPVALLLASAALLLAALPPSQAKPYVLSPAGGGLGGSGTQIVVNELEEETVQIEQRVGASRDAAASALAEALSVEQREEPAAVLLEEDVELALEVDTGDQATTVPPPRCKLRECWKGCQRRGYNWGLCLCKKCHCYY